MSFHLLFIHVVQWYLINKELGVKMLALLAFSVNRMQICNIVEVRFFFFLKKQVPGNIQTFFFFCESQDKSMLGIVCVSSLLILRAFNAGCQEPAYITFLH